MWKWIVVGVVALVVLAGGIFLWMLQGPDVSKYEFLKNPRITEKPDTPVLEVPFQVSSQDLPRVFGILMKTYFKLSRVPKGPKMSAPAARYENALDFNLDPEKRAQTFATMVWKGSAAIPVPATRGELPASVGEPNMMPRLSVWKYGEVAEILHLGSYEAEAPTVNKLKSYIESQGYEIAGLHEEEYLRGPGMPFSNPKNYYTIIRYPVKKKIAVLK